MAVILVATLTGLNCRGSSGRFGKALSVMSLYISWIGFPNRKRIPYILSAFVQLKRVKTDHLLTGLVFCGKCGAKMRYIKWGKDGYRLMCYSQQTSKAYLVKNANCDQAKVRAEDVEDAVITALFEMADNFSKGKVAIPQTIDTLSLLEGQRDKINGKIKRLYNLYADDGDQNLLDTIAELKGQLLDVERKIEIEKNARLVSKGIQENFSMLSNIRDLWPTFSYEKKYGIIKRLVKQVKLTGEHIDIEFNV